MLPAIRSKLQENDILDMRFVSGDSPHDFWLRFYSTKELKEIRSGIQKLFEANKLQPLKSSKILGGHFCVCDGSDYFRGRVIDQCTDPQSYMVLNVDNGGILKVKKDNMYLMTEELLKFPVQAINCCLEGVLGDRALWDACLVELFHQLMKDSTLVVTVCSLPTESSSKFVVQVDVHNEMRAESKIDLNNGIKYLVLPTLLEKSASKAADTLKLLFDSLRSEVELESNASLEENGTTECSSSIQEAQRHEYADSNNLYAKDNTNGNSNSTKNKSYIQEPQTNCALWSSSSLSVNSIPLYAMLPQDKLNTAEQSNTFLSLNSSPVHTMPDSKEKANVQQQQQQQPPPPPPSVQQLTRSPTLYSMPAFTVPHFLPYQNPPMLVPISPSFPVNQPVYPYAPQMQPPLLQINPFHNAGLSVALQQQKQPQYFQLQTTPAQTRLLRKQHISQRLAAVSSPKVLKSNAKDTQKERGNSRDVSLMDKEKEATLITNTLQVTHRQMKKTSMLKENLFAEAEAFGEDFSVCKQEASPPKVNSNSTDTMSKVSLKYPNLKLEVGKRYWASLVHINDPDDFYIHVVCKYRAFLKTLDHEMTANYKTCPFRFTNKKQAKIMLYESWCAVAYEDTCLWHRGKVINWKDDNDTTLEVQYVDYGEVREVDLSMIKPLKEEYTKLPICATRCKLAHIQPPILQGDGKHNTWPSEAIQLFEELAVRYKLHSIVVTNTSDPISVLLVTEDEVVINKTLLEFEYALALKPIEFDPRLPMQLITENEENVGKSMKLNGNALNKLTENCRMGDRLNDSGKTPGHCPEGEDKENILQKMNPMVEDYFAEGDVQYHDDENACCAVSRYIPQDEQQICKLYAKNDHCFKDAIYTKEHSMPNSDGWTTDQEIVLQNTFSNLVLPPTGTSVTVVATAMCTLNIFYAHIFWEGRIKKEEEEILLTLHKSINSKDNVSKMKRLHTTPAVGQLVLARSKTDVGGNFCRARVIDTSIEVNIVRVVYVDYGDTKWVSEKDIREMEEKYLHLPFQALECFISNVRPKTHSKDALSDLSHLLLGRQLDGMLVSKNILGQAEIELWDGDQKISDKLIKKGYADYRKSPSILSERASIIPG